MAMASLLYYTSSYTPCTHFSRTSSNRLLHPFPLKFKASPSPTRSSLTISAFAASTTPSTSSLFLARLSRATSTSLSAPLAVVALTAAKWLNLYTTLLTVRVLLSWFPNISWDRQPFSAVRDLCDPYLSLFRNILPPVFGTLDLSPFLAFAVLHVLASILTATAR